MGEPEKDIDLADLSLLKDETAVDPQAFGRAVNMAARQVLADKADTDKAEGKNELYLRNLR